MMCLSSADYRKQGEAALPVRWMAPEVCMCCVCLATDGLCRHC